MKHGVASRELATRLSVRRVLEQQTDSPQGSQGYTLLLRWLPGRTNLVDGASKQSAAHPASVSGHRTRQHGARI